MEPTYYSGDIIFINTLRYQFREPRRGDIVAISTGIGRVSLFRRSPLILKRVVGLPGERLAFQKGILTVNGQPIPEPRLKRRPRWNLPEVKIGPDEFFVVGDNRFIPPETHYHGRVKRYRIIGGPLF
jgi:signal peptidase I